MNAKQAKSTAMMLKHHEHNQQLSTILKEIEEKAHAGYLEFRTTKYIFPSVIDKLVELGYEYEERQAGYNENEQIISWENAN